MIFHGVKGLEDREKNSPSYFNRLEIQILTDYVQKLMTTRLSGRKVTEKDIGIIAPYRKQVRWITNWNSVEIRYRILGRIHEILIRL